jgi:threonine/homoserine/homoserine lactone efflux protein
MNWLQLLLNPPSGLHLGEILLISFILGILHGATPDEHTWPITFSYAVGKYSTRGGMKAGFLFSLGFTVQRALLTTLGYLGLAQIYNQYNLDGPVYVAVGVAMAAAGLYVIKGRYVHLPIDVLLGGRRHHSDEVGGVPMHELEERDVPLGMTVVHGLIAGFGFGAYASVITFVLAPQTGSIAYAPLPGLFFGLGTMAVQVVFGALFGAIMRMRGLTEEQIRRVARRTAGFTLYYGGLLFIAAGGLIVALPEVDAWAVATGVPVPNLDSINIGTILVLAVVGILGIGTMLREIGIGRGRRP